MCAGATIAASLAIPDGPAFGKRIDEVTRDVYGLVNSSRFVRTVAYR